MTLDAHHSRWLGVGQTQIHPQKLRRLRGWSSYIENISHLGQYNAEPAIERSLETEFKRQTKTTKTPQLSRDRK